jgi:putative nucleotidyltransferase with HDIG domain
MLLHLLELRDPYTLGHSVRVARIAKLIAEESKVKIDIKNLQYAALLHDIGKIAVPDSILHKATILSKAEKILIEQHTVLGYESVQNLRIPDIIKETIYYHHESYDGTGYPLKLKGNEIPSSARIVKIADV